MIDNETRQYIIRNINCDPRKLALSKAPNNVDIKLALQQIAAHKKAMTKIPFFSSLPDIVYPKEISMEQCSSQVTALYKKRLAHSLLGESYSLIDLTGGFGVDCFYLHCDDNKSVYVETNKELCSIAKHNYSILKSNIEVVNADSTAYINNISNVDLVFIDPARRDCNGNKVVLLEHCTPDITTMLPNLAEKAKCVMIKLSPMFDITALQRQIPYLSEIHVVSYDNDCKELIVICSTTPCNSVSITAVNINRNNEFSSTLTINGIDNQTRIDYSDCLNYMYEPYASFLKAGMFNALSLKFGLLKIAPNTHLYTSNEVLLDFPGRIFKVNEVIEFSKKDVVRFFKLHPQLNITTRNFNISVAELRKQFKVKEGGNEYLFATSDMNNKRMLVLCECIRH